MDFHKGYLFWVYNHISNIRMVPSSMASRVLEDHRDDRNFHGGHMP